MGLALYIYLAFATDHLICDHTFRVCGEYEVGSRKPRSVLVKALEMAAKRITFVCVYGVCGWPLLNVI